LHSGWTGCSLRLVALYQRREDPFRAEEAAQGKTWLGVDCLPPIKFSDDSSALAKPQSRHFR
jgi:hypothetical protein